MKRIIREKSFEIYHVPANFYIVTEYSDLLKSQFLTYQLPGVSGISDSGFIVLDFLEIGRDTVIMMPGMDTVNLNNLSRVMYNNPHYLVSKGLSALFRLWSKRQDNDYDYIQVITTLSKYVSMAAKDMGLRDIYQLMNPTMYSFSSAVKPFINNLKKVSNLSQFVSIFRKILESNTSSSLSPIIRQMSDRDFHELVKRGFEELSDTWRREGEWLVKDKNLKIPKNSKIISTIYNPEEFLRWQKTRELSDNIPPLSRDTLVKRYTNFEVFYTQAKSKYSEVLLLSSKEFDDFRNQLLATKTNHDEIMNTLFSKYSVFSSD